MLLVLVLELLMGLQWLLLLLLPPLLWLLCILLVVIWLLVSIPLHLGWMMVLVLVPLLVVVLPLVVILVQVLMMLVPVGVTNREVKQGVSCCYCYITATCVEASCVVAADAGCSVLWWAASKIEPVDGWRGVGAALLHVLWVR